MTPPLGFKARVHGFYLICFCGGKCNIHSLRFTSGVTPVNLLMTSIAVGHFPTCISRGGSWLRFGGAITRNLEQEKKYENRLHFRWYHQIVRINTFPVPTYSIYFCFHSITVLYFPLFPLFSLFCCSLMLTENLHDGDICTEPGK